MRSAPHLLAEDRPEYERLLGHALSHAHERPELAGAGERLNLERLRTMALNATALITAAAATEYEQYVQAREQHHGSASPDWSTGSLPATSAYPVTDGMATDHPASAGLGHRFGAAVLGGGRPDGRRISDGVSPVRWTGMSFGRRTLAALLGLRVRPEPPKARGGTSRAPAQRSLGRTPLRARATERGAPVPEGTGAGVPAVVTVLVTVLAGAAATILLLAGYLLKAFNPPSPFASTLVGAGWWAAVITAAGVVVGAAGLCVTALRNGPSPPVDVFVDADEDEDADADDLPEEVARAREAWRHALMERGILPFMRDALGDPADPPPRTPRRSADLIPRLGYSRPDFSGPADRSAAGPRPSFSSPDHTDPDFGSPEARPE